MTKISLKAFADSDLSLLEAWLSCRHVAPWYPDPQEHLEWARKPPPGGHRALIVVGTSPVGYIRWQRVTREALDAVGLRDLPAGAVDVDILIGDREHTQKGVGPEALRVLLGQLQGEGDVSLVGLTTSIHNLHAQRAFKKAGFCIDRRYQPEGYGPCYLMLHSGPGPVPAAMPSAL